MYACMYVCMQGGRGGKGGISDILYGQDGIKGQPGVRLSVRKVGCVCLCVCAHSMCVNTYVRMHGCVLTDVTINQVMCCWCMHGHASVSVAYMYIYIYIFIRRRALYMLELSLSLPPSLSLTGCSYSFRMCC